MSGTFTTPKRRNGVAGQIAVTTTVTYIYEEDGVTVTDAPHEASLVGSAFGGPVLLVTGPGAEQQIFVSGAVEERIGFPFEDDPVSWTRAFWRGLEEVAR